MKKPTSSGKIYIQNSKISGAGRGVFALQNIKKGTVIETCPAIHISKYDFSNVNQSILTTYFFSPDKDKENLLLALGFGSLYNHSYQPNAKYKINSKEQNLNFIAIRDIKKNEEITINYKGQNSKNKNPLWFE